MKKRYWIAFGIAGIIIIVMSAYHFWQRPTRGDIAPPFTLRDLSGKSISLADYRENFILLHFWNTRCDVCRYELAAVEHLNQKFKDRGLVILSVLVDEEKTKDLESTIDSMAHVTFPVLLDSDGVVADVYQVYGVPESFIIGRDGIILERLTGGIDWDALPHIVYFDRLLK